MSGEDHDGQTGLSLALKQRAYQEGFDPVGIARLPGSERLQLRTAALQRWLDITYHSTSYNVRSRKMLCGLVEKVAAAGSWAAYERAHRMQLARIFAPKLPRIPKYVVPTVVAYWAHTGYY